MLAEQFDPTIDAQQPEIGLGNCRWYPLDIKTLGLAPFVGILTGYALVLARLAGHLGARLSAIPPQKESESDHDRGGFMGAGERECQYSN